MPDSVVVREVYNRLPKSPPGGAIHISLVAQGKNWSG